MKVSGQCHCGAIAYEAEVEAGTVNVCHCLDCQTLSGTAFRMSIQAPASSFRLLSGNPRRYIKTADSGAKRAHAFCETCGSPVYACDPENPKTYSLRVGALNERQLLDRPARQIWTTRRLSWLPKFEGVREIERQQP
jgi:hypothetical protein